MEIKQQAFHVFDKLKLGQSIIIAKFAKNDPAAFTQYAMEYIDNGGGLEFNEDYSIIRKVESREQIRAMIAYFDNKLLKTQAL